jgi:hypothetical protein
MKAILSFKAKTWLLSVVLLAGLFFQGWRLIGNVGQNMLRVRGAIGQAGLWRSANFGQNQRFANYVQFLNENIPTNARVVLPPEGGGLKVLSTTPYMQFFLAPRQVLNCTDAACLQTISRENTYFLVVGDFPADGRSAPARKVRMFDSEWGLLLPDHPPPPGNASFQPGFQSLFEIFQAAVWPAAWLILMVVGGFLFSRRLVPEVDIPSRLSLGYGLALFALSIGIGLAGIAGMTINSGLVLGITVFFCVASLWSGYIAGRLHRAANASSGLPVPPGRRIDLWQIAFLILGGAAVLLSVGQGYHTADEIQIWGVKGYGIALTGDMSTVTSWGTNTLPYPLQVPILIAAFRSLFQETLPASKVIFSGYYLALLFLVYGFLVQIRVHRPIAGLATLLLASTPILFRHATIGFANLPMAYYLVSAVILFAGVIAIPAPRQAEGRIFLSGVFFAAAAWTRPEGLMLAWLGVILLLGLAYFKRAGVLSLRQLLRSTQDKAQSEPWRQAALLIAPLCGYWVFWWLVKAMAYSDQAAKSGLAMEAIQRNLGGDFHLVAAGYILRSLFTDLFSAQVWGVLGIGMLLAGALALVRPGRWRGAISPILSCGLLYILAILGMYYLTSYDSLHDISWWVNSGLERMMLPGVILLWIWGVSLVKSLDDGEDRPSSTDGK